MSDLPAGFVLDQPKPAAPVAGLPEGFVLDQGPPAQAQAPEKQPFGLLDTWPARLAKGIYSAVTLPGDVLAGKAQVPQSANMPGGESTENIGRVTDLAGLISPITPRAVPSLTRPVTPTAPSSEALATAVDTGFAKARSTGAEISPSAIGRVSQEAQTKLFEGGADATTAPKTFATLANLERPPPGATVTIANLHSLRKNLGGIASDAVRQGAGEEARAARAAQQSLDIYLGSLPKTDVVVGDPAAAAQVLREAIGNAAAEFRSKAVQDIGETARLNIISANTPGQLGRELRQGAKRLAKSDETRGFSAAEKAQLEAVMRAGRFPGIAGSMLGGGSPVMSMLAAVVGGHLTGGPGAVAPAIGLGIKQLEARAAQRQLQKLDEMIRARSPLGQQTMGPPAPYAPNPAIWDPLRRLYPQIPFFAQPPQ